MYIHNPVGRSWVRGRDTTPQNRCPKSNAHPDGLRINFGSPHPLKSRFEIQCFSRWPLDRFGVDLAAQRAPKSRPRKSQIRLLMYTSDRFRKRALLQTFVLHYQHGEDAIRLWKHKWRQRFSLHHSCRFCLSSYHAESSKLQVQASRSILDRFWLPKWVPNRGPEGVKTCFLMHISDRSRKKRSLQAFFLHYQHWEVAIWL